MKYNLKTENKEKAGMFCSGKHPWDTDLPRSFCEAPGLPTHGINTEMDTIYCPTFLLEPIGRAAGPHRNMPQNLDFIAQSSQKNPNWWSNLVVLRCTKTWVHTIIAATETATSGKSMRQEQLHLSHLNLVSHLVSHTLGAEIPALSSQQQLGAPIICTGLPVLLWAITVSSRARVYSVKGKPRTSDSDRHTPLDPDRNTGSS